MAVGSQPEALTRKGVIRSRTGPFGNTPYIEVPLDLAKAGSSSLRRVVVGPGNDKVDVKQSIERLLEAKGLRVKRGGASNIGDGVVVSVSTIPYRSG